MKVVEINWGLLTRNPLDFLDGDIDFELATPDGKRVKITKPMVEFKVEIDGEVELRTRDNTNVCYLLNTRQVGWIDE